MSFDVDILDWNDDGRGRGRHGRKAVLVSQAHPGERVRVRVDRTTRGTVQGRVGRLLGEPDGQRVGHACEHAFVCTGCPWLALDFDEEARLKEARLRSILGSVPGLEAPSTEALPIEPLLRPGQPFGYRHYTKQILHRRGGRTIAGAYVAGTHEVADNRSCPVLAPALASLVTAMVEEIDRAGLRIFVEGRGGRSEATLGLRYLVARESRATGRQLLTLITATDPASEPGMEERRLCQWAVDSQPGLAGVHLYRHSDPGNTLLGGEKVFAVGEDHIEDELAGFRHRVGPTSFFQVNPQTADAMVRAAVEMAGEGGVAVDAFCGVGALTLPLAERFGRVLAVERSEEAIGLLEETARAAGSGDRIEAVADDARQRLPAWLGAEPIEAVVLDPPRRGLGADLARALAASSVRRVVLLSCDPESLRGDLPPLLDAGFALRRVLPVDPFPRTAHLETVTLLER